MNTNYHVETLLKNVQCNFQAMENCWIFKERCTSVDMSLMHVIARMRNQEILNFNYR